MSDPLLRVTGVRKAFGRHEVLAGVDLEIGPGELVGVVGENGSGKTTLLEILVGRLGRDAGTLTLSGRLGYCPQRSLVFDRLTLRENFRWFGAAYDLPDWGPRMQDLAERYRFGPWLDAFVSDVSGGTRQKLNLAIALLHDPVLIVLDEPYAGFDWETYLAFWGHAAALRADGRGLLVVSHLLHDRERFDRIYTLADGVLTCA